MSGVIVTRSPSPANGIQQIPTIGSSERCNRSKSRGARVGVHVFSSFTGHDVRRFRVIIFQEFGRLRSFHSTKLISLCSRAISIALGFGPKVAVHGGRSLCDELFVQLDAR
jgi:hypothetical protein